MDFVPSGVNLTHFVSKSSIPANLIWIWFNIGQGDIPVQVIDFVDLVV